MNKNSAWYDLRLRLISASILLFACSLCIYFGGYLFTLFIIALVGVIHWELGKMLSPMSVQAMWFSSILSVAVTFYLVVSDGFLWPI